MPPVRTKRTIIETFLDCMPPHDREIVKSSYMKIRDELELLGKRDAPRRARLYRLSKVYKRLVQRKKEKRRFLAQKHKRRAGLYFRNGLYHH